MALRWLVHSVCASLGYPQDFNPKQSQIQIAHYLDRESLDLRRAKPPPTAFQMPLHYPRYKKADYESMEEWRLEMLLEQYGLSCQGTVEEKRSFAMGAFLWPDQY